MMNEKLDWLQKLGDAFLAQQQAVMASIQRLRARAQASGQLKSTPEQQVTAQPVAATQAPPPPAAAPQAEAPPAAPPAAQTPAAPTTVQVTQPPPTVITIEPTNPQVIAVPSYDPTVVYGAWPPAYPPYYPYPAGYFAAGAFTFAAGAAVGAALWGDCDWGHGDVNIDNDIANNFTRNVNNNEAARARVEQRQSARAPGAAGQTRGSWQHSPEHRKGVQYRDTATQQRFNRTGPANAQSREAYRGRSGQADVSRAAQQGAAGQQAARDRQAGIGQQPGGGLADRGGQASPRTDVAQGRAAQGRQAAAFEGMGSGRDAQSFSNRGNTSRQSYNRSTGASSRTTGGGGGRAGGRAGGGRR
jgi:hypothetical protein